VARIFSDAVTGIVAMETEDTMEGEKWIDFIRFYGGKGETEIQKDMSVIILIKYYVR
jgi:hypothetical protein